MAYNSDNQQRDDRNSGFINFNYDENDKAWKVSGTFTTHENKKVDLGFVVTSGQLLTESITIVAKHIGPAIAGKGLPKRRRA